MGRRWRRGRWIFALVVAAVLQLAGLVGDRGGVVGSPRDPTRGEARLDDPGPARLDARRRWALRKMDEMAMERLRCRERFKVRRQIEECEADYNRRYRQYNEIYLEASRE